MSWLFTFTSIQWKFPQHHRYPTFIIAPCNVVSFSGEVAAELVYEICRQRLLGLYGACVGVLQLFIVILYGNYIYYFDIDTNAPNYNDFIHSMNCLISYSAISLFSLFSSLCYDAFMAKHYVDFIILVLLSILNIWIHVKAMKYVNNSIYLSQQLLQSNFTTTVLNNLLNYWFRDLYQGNPYLLPIFILHIGLITVYLSIQILIEGKDTLKLNDTLDGYEAYQAHLHNKNLSNIGAIGEWCKKRQADEGSVELATV